MKSSVKTIVTVTTTAAVTFAATSVLYAVGSGSFQAAAGNETERKLDTVNAYLENNYLYDDYDESELGEEAVKAYVEALGEPYTCLLYTSRCG